jgi:transposase
MSSRLKRFVRSQIVDTRSLSQVAERLGTTTHSLYAWVKKFGPKDKSSKEAEETERELRRLKAELRRVTEERDILKKTAAYFAKESG